MNWQLYSYWFCPEHGCLGAGDDPDCRQHHEARTGCRRAPHLLTFPQWQALQRLRRVPPRRQPIGWGAEANE
jgi:hypothetical protein